MDNKIKKEGKKSAYGGDTMYLSGDGKNETLMKCSNCGYRIDWAGNYLGGTFTCGVCHQKTLEGVEYRE